MFAYWWYRHVHFRQEFEKDNRVDIFAEYYMSSNLDRIKAKGDKLRRRLRAITSARSQWMGTRDRLASEGQLLSEAEFPAVASKYRRLLLLLVLIGVGESGLNMFTAMIAIPAAGIFGGAIGDLARLAVAIIVTVVGIVAAEIFFGETLPQSEKSNGSGRSWPKIALWAVVLIGIEYMIYHFGWARVKDIEGGNVNPDVAKSIIGLSMIVPVVGGGIAWELSTIHSPYKNRLKHDKCVRRVDRADTLIESLREQENGDFQKKTNDYWRTFNRLKSFKEYYNTKCRIETGILQPETRYAATYADFYGEALHRYSEHKERQDPVALTKLASSNVGVVGMKIGQDHAQTANNA